MSAFKLTKTAVFGSLDILPGLITTSTPSSSYSNVRSSDFKSFTTSVLDAVSVVLSEFGQESGVLYDNAKTLSITERTATYKVGERLNYTYGEVTIASMARIFDMVYKHRRSHASNIFNQTKGGKFVDLGSGSGIPVFMAAMLHPFDTCHGIEILTTLHDMAIKGKMIWDEKYQKRLSSPVQFTCGSITDLSVHDWRDADLVFVNSTCFDNALIQSVDRLARGLRSGAYIVTLSQQLGVDAFELVAEDRLEMSWGMADVFCHIRNTVPVSDTSTITTTTTPTPMSLGDCISTSQVNEIVLDTMTGHSVPSKHGIHVTGNVNPSAESTTNELINASTSSSSRLKVLPLDPDAPRSEITIVSISDTHGLHQLIRTVPLGDVLIHAGDFTETGQLEQIEDFVEWMHSQPHRYKFFIAGNHELTLQADYYLEYGKKQFHRLRQYDPEECRRVLFKYPDVIYLEDSGASLEFPISRDRGNGTIGDKIDTAKVRIYGSPWQPEFCRWAFNLNRGEEILRKWQLIPDDTDILITHGPPIGYGDRCSDGRMVGCRYLSNEIRRRVHPRLHIFGHIHESYGVFSDTNTSAADGSATDKCLFINASTCTERYRPINPPVVVRYPLDKSSEVKKL